MSKLSSREKMLIYIMICVAIAIGVLMFVITPLKKAYDKVSEDNEMLETQKLSMSMGMTGTDSYKNGLDTALEGISQLEKDFYVGLTYDDIDKSLTTKMLKHGLLPTDLSMSEFKEEYVEETTEEESEETGDENADQEEKVLPEYFHNIKADIKATGNITAIYGFLNELSKDDKIVVSDFLIDKDKETYELSVSVKYYILK